MSKLLVLGSYGEIPGGISKVLSSVVPRLKDSFDEILVIVPRKRRRFHRNFSDDNITVRYQPCGTIPRFSVSQPFIQIVRVWRRIKKEIKDFTPDIVWSNTPTTDIAAKLAGLRNIVRTVHGLPLGVVMPEVDVSNIYDWKINMWAITKLEQEGLKNVVSTITTYSNYLKNKIESYYKPKAAIHVIPNGIDPNLFHPMPLEKSNVVTYIGRISIVKGIHILLRAMKHVHQFYPNWKLQLVGDASEQSMKYFKNIYNHGIVWVRHVPHNKVPNILNQSKIFVMPTLRDGFEIALMEAVACGIPSITTRAYERKEIYRDLVTFTALNDSFDLAKKIICLIENWEECYKKAQKASEVVREKFSWDLIAKEYLKVFKASIQYQKL